MKSFSVQYKLNSFLTWKGTSFLKCLAYVTKNDMVLGNFLLTDAK